MEEGRGGSLETGLDRSERIETCFDRFKRVNLNGLKRVSTGFNRSERVLTCFDRFERVSTGSNSNGSGQI